MKITAVAILLFGLSFTAATAEDASFGLEPTSSQLVFKHFKQHQSRRAHNVATFTCCAQYCIYCNSGNTCWQDRWSKPFCCGPGARGGSDGLCY